MAGLCVAPTQANAQEDAEPVRVEFQAVASCPDGTAFFRAVLARTPRVRRAHAGESARVFHVTIERPADDQVSGDFWVTDPDDPNHDSSKRTITGESCTEVLDALALFAAISVDPEAVTTDLPKVSAPSAPVATAPPTPTSEVQTRLTSSGPEPRNMAELHVKRSGTTRTRVGAGLRIGAMSAGTPARLLLVEPFVEIGRHQVARAGWFAAPALRLAFSSTGTNSARGSDGFAQLHWTTLRLDGCPAELNIARAFSIRPCLAFSAGLLSATGVITHPNSQRLPWWTLGGLIHAEWNVVTALALEADAGFDAPFRRDQLYFDPSTPVYRAPAAMARVSLGVGVHFP